MKKQISAVAILACVCAPLAFAAPMKMTMPDGCAIAPGTHVVKGHTFYAKDLGKRALWIAPGGVYVALQSGKTKVYQMCKHIIVGGSSSNIRVPVKRGANGQFYPVHH